MYYTRASTPREALLRLADRVPLAVVTCGSDGALAIDADTGAVVSAPAVPVEALDPTGAGDVFTAGFVAAALWGLPLRERLAFANLVAALSVRHDVDAARLTAVGRVLAPTRPAWSPRRWRRTSATG